MYIDYLVFTKVEVGSFYMPTIQDLMFKILYIYFSVTSLAVTVLCH